MSDLDPVRLSAALLAALLGVVMGVLLHRRLRTRAYRYPAEREYAVPVQWWIVPVSGLIWAALTWSFLDRPTTLGVLLTLTVPLLWLAAVDHDVHRLPDRVQKPLVLVLAAALVLPAAVEGAWTDYVRALLGGVLAFVAYFLLAVVGRGGLGWGDVKLAPILGMACAWVSWSVLVAGMVAGVLLAGAWGLYLMAFRGAHRKDFIPLGPFLIIGALCTLGASGSL